MITRVLEGRNISLRSIQVLDADGPYLSWLNDKEINEYLESRFINWTTDLLRSYILDIEQREDQFLFAICLKDQPVHIGNIKIGPINPHHRFADVGIMIGEKKYWGRGFASEAIREICKFGFEELKLNKITAGCYEANGGSVKSFERVGFEIEGRQRKKLCSESGFQDHILMGILGSDFKYTP